MNTLSRFSFSVLLLALPLFGWGCRPAAAPQTTPAGPKPATFDNLSPSDAAKKVAFVPSSVIRLRQTFRSAGAALAKEAGWGSEIDREVVIRKFAPGVRADVEWKAVTSVPLKEPKDGQTAESKQYTGTVLDGNLQSSRDLFLPVYWAEGERSALNSSLLWLSRDVYENLVKGGVSTFGFGIVTPDQYGSLKMGPALAKGVRSLESEVKRIIDRKDVYLTTAEPERSEWTLKINGQDVKVEVLKAKSWFGEIVALNNPQNPLVLKVTVNKLADGALEGYFDYEVTELRDLQE